MSLIYNGSRISEPVFALSSTDGVTISVSITGVVNLDDLSNKFLLCSLPVAGGENASLNVNSLGGVPIVYSINDSGIKSDWINANIPFGLVYNKNSNKFVLVGAQSLGNCIINNFSSVEQLADDSDVSTLIPLTKFNELLSSNNILLVDSSNNYSYSVLSKVINSDSNFVVICLVYIDSSSTIKSIYLSKGISDNNLYKGNKISV